MKSSIAFLALTAGAVIALAPSALAGFTGQPIMGPISNPASVTGDLTGAPDNNDGFFSGDHVFDIWDGGDNVWKLNWTGGDMLVELLYDNKVCDPDLFLYTPDSLDESSYDSYTNVTDSIFVPDAAPGMYFILIDSAAGSEGAYQLNVTPAPGAATLFGIACCGFARRSRRAL